MSKKLRLGIAGLGTVGVGVAKLLMENAELLSARAGQDLEIVAVCARDQRKDRGIDVSKIGWLTDPVALAQRDDVDVFVELIGGETGPAYDSVVAALKMGKIVVTANKALVAVHGVELSALLNNYGGQLFYEAAVAGGIPAIKLAREGIAANQIDSVFGILNGTCNYILTTMEADQRDFDDVLQGAIELGYAEAEPSVDVDGWDAAHKLAILTAICFGGAPDMDHLSVSGIRSVTLQTISMADELGYKIKLLGFAARDEQPFVAACAVPKSSSIAAVDGSFNAVVFNGRPVDEIMVRGRGAGEGPTASAVVADLIDVARGILPPIFGGTPTNNVTQRSDVMAKQMVAFNVKDEPGVIAAISDCLSQSGLSVESMLQRAGDGEQAHVMIVTHPTDASSVSEAQEILSQKPFMHRQPAFYRVVASEQL